MGELCDFAVVASVVPEIFALLGAYSDGVFPLAMKTFSAAMFVLS